MDFWYSTGFTGFLQVANVRLPTFQSKLSPWAGRRNKVGSDKKKIRNFDLGSSTPAILVECKSHTWTQSGNIPSARLTVWN
jgi:hypothetical protein